MSGARFRSFEEFWPFYVAEHANKTTRNLHFLGTTAALACAAGSVVFGKPRLLKLAPLLGYGPAWFSHYFVEKNRPATFRHPLWSLRGDVMMWSMMLRGRMDAEVERVLAEKRHAEAAAQTPEGPAAPSSDDAASSSRRDLN